MERRKQLENFREDREPYSDRELDKHRPRRSRLQPWHLQSPHALWKEGPAHHLLHTPLSNLERQRPFASASEAASNQMAFPTMCFLSWSPVYWCFLNIAFYFLSSLQTNSISREFIRNQERGITPLLWARNSIGKGISCHSGVSMLMKEFICSGVHSHSVRDSMTSSKAQMSNTLKPLQNIGESIVFKVLMSHRGWLW